MQINKTQNAGKQKNWMLLWGRKSQICVAGEALLHKNNMTSHIKFNWIEL